jgi:hypothetical protein
MMLITEGSLDLLVNLMVLGVEKSHTVDEDGVVMVIAKADDRRLIAVMVNEQRILTEWNYGITRECAGGMSGCFSRKGYIYLVDSLETRSLKDLFTEISMVHLKPSALRIRDSARLAQKHLGRIRSLT